MAGEAVLPGQGCDHCWQCPVLLLRHLPSPWRCPGDGDLALGCRWWPSVRAGLDSVLILSKFCQASPLLLLAFSAVQGGRVRGK